MKCVNANIFTSFLSRKKESSEKLLHALLITQISKDDYAALKSIFMFKKDTERWVEKVLERIPLIGLYLKANPFK